MCVPHTYCDIVDDIVGNQVSCSAEDHSAVRSGRFPVSKYSKTPLYIAGHPPHLDTLSNQVNKQSSNLPILPFNRYCGGVVFYPGIRTLMKILKLMIMAGGEAPKTWEMTHSICKRCMGAPTEVGYPIVTSAEISTGMWINGPSRLKEATNTEAEAEYWCIQGR